MQSIQSSKEDERGWLSSPFAIVAAVAIVAFTYGTTPKFALLPWPLKLVVIWSYVLSAALLVWAAKRWFKINGIGNPTLSMIAGASGTAIAAIALALTLSSARDQDDKLKEQAQLLREQNAVLREQLVMMKRIAVSLQHMQGGMPPKPPSKPPEGITSRDADRK